MAYQFPTEDLKDGQIEYVPQKDGSFVAYEWISPPGVWKAIINSAVTPDGAEERPPIYDGTNNQPTEYPNPNTPQLKQGDMWIDAQGALYIYYNDQWNKTSTYTNAVLPDDATPFSITAPDGTVFNTQADYNKWLFEHLDRPPIFQPNEPNEHPDYPGDDLVNGDIWVDDNNNIYLYIEGEWIGIVTTDDFVADQLRQDNNINELTNYLQGLIDGGVQISDLFVAKAGDTMTGALVMDDAGEIEMIDTALEMRRTMQNDGSDTWDPNRDRFGTIRPRAPKIINDDGTEIIDGTDNFGINFDLSDRNTYRNTLKVSSKDNEILRIQSGGQPNVVFNDTIDRSGLANNQGIEAGVVIKGIPTPDRELTPGDFAVNKEYVDREDEILLNGLIDLQEEIDAIAPSLEKGAWEFDTNALAANNTSRPPDSGKYYLLSGVFPTWTITDQYDQADAVVFHNTDSNGVVHGNWDAVVADKLILLFDKPDPDKCLGVVTQVSDDVLNDSVIIEFNRTEGFGKPNNNQDDNGKYITFVNIFEAPSGGTASEFVLKKGDQMSGNLTMVKDPFNNGDVSPKIEFKSKRDDGGVYTNALLMPYNTSNTLKAIGPFEAGGSIFSGGTISADGNLQYNGSTRMYLGSTSTTHYLGFGTSTNYQAIQWDKTNGLTQIRAKNSYGSNGQVLTKTSTGVEWKSSSSPTYTISKDSNGNFYIS